MKSKTSLLVAIAFITMSFNNAALTDAERKFASDLLQQTQENLVKKVSGLSAEQLNFKPDTNSWSVAECVEHLAIAENNLFGFSQAALKEPADPSKRKDLIMSDEVLVSKISDRSSKVNTSESLKPSGKFGTYEAALNEFKAKRASNIGYIKTTTDDLRNHYNDFPFGKLDAYQTILLMASHSKRHADQIEEIMNHPNFPKKGK
ncbi:DinB family protein [Paradesertivirga mongoliensis]|uniref:DinB family protein n=1 Tax=Paradesertivirga mongoliensis TaxID=2100740 RepID=A0ABW4ZR56_9SPHI|nr:DinB family protein [Pedobacter mongoliensis]